MALNYDNIQAGNVDELTRRLMALYKKTLENSIKIGDARLSYKTPSPVPFDFGNYPAMHKAIIKELATLSQKSISLIEQAEDKSFLISKQKNDKLVKTVFGKTPPAAISERYLGRNIEGLAAFKKRTDNGLNLSDRVWNHTKTFENEISIVLNEGLILGKPARSIAYNTTKFLKYPDKVFPRRYDKAGKLMIPPDLVDFHPGTGVYKSSFMNANRLARTETNMMYRSADFDTHNQFEFVVGFEVKRSNNIYSCPICGELAGKYPKTFKFVGWHPHCRCYVVPILCTPDELDALTDQILNDENLDGFTSIKGVTAMPQNYKDYTDYNGPRLVKAQNPPYWVRDNYIKGQFKNGLRPDIPPPLPPSARPAPGPPVIPSLPPPVPVEPPKPPAPVPLPVEPPPVPVLGVPVEPAPITYPVLKTVFGIDAVMQDYIKLYPEDFAKGRISVETFNKKASRAGYTAAKAINSTGQLYLNTGRSHLGDSTYKKVLRAFNKIRKKEALDYDEEYAIETTYHELLHIKAQKRVQLNAHYSGDYKRTAMETVNQFIARHDYPVFMRRFGAQAIHQADILEKGGVYGSWVSRFRNLIKKSGVKETDVADQLRPFLLEKSYANLDAVLAKTIRHLGGEPFANLSDDKILDALENPGFTWAALLHKVPQK